MTLTLVEAHVLGGNRAHFVKRVNFTALFSLTPKRKPHYSLRTFPTARPANAVFFLENHLAVL
jgi:hypothetical protein